MSNDTLMKILGAIGAIGTGVGGGLAGGPVGAIIGGVVGLVTFLAGANHSQASVGQLLSGIASATKQDKQ
jgi:hypothetical protein